MVLVSLLWKKCFSKSATEKSWKKKKLKRREFKKILKKLRLLRKAQEKMEVSKAAPTLGAWQPRKSLKITQSVLMRRKMCSLLICTIL